MPKIKVKWFKQESAHSKWTHGRYQTYYLPYYAIDNNQQFILVWL